jgi:hypothetical protein
MDTEPADGAYRLGDGLMVQPVLTGNADDTVLEVQFALTDQGNSVQTLLRRQGATHQTGNLDSQNRKNQILINPAHEYTVLTVGDFGGESSRLEVALPKTGSS